MYILGLGELGFLEHWIDEESKISPRNLQIAYVALFMATWLILIVFMNIIIAMMGETFENV